MSAVIAVVGEGLLADIVCGELSDRYKIVRRTDFRASVPEATKLILLIYEGDWLSSAYSEAEEVMQQAGIPWLRGFVSLNEGVVGPLIRPGIPGCSQCADNRRFIAGRDTIETMELLNVLEPAGKLPGITGISRSALWQVAHLLAAEAHRVLEGKRARSEEHVFLIDLNSLKSSLHFFLPDPQCTGCARLPDDSAAAARITLEPRRKISAGSYRCRSLEDLKDVLIRDYLDSRCGLFNIKEHDLVSPFSIVSVNLPSFMMGDIVSSGRSHSYAESEITAILEGLERSCGLSPIGKRTVIRDSFNNIADQALNPIQVGVYTKEQYALPDFPFEPFDPDQPIDWIWGYSFMQERPILVPEVLAYYSQSNGGGFIQEGSNGCALGGSIEEAVLYGILEVAERDSFLMTWYAKLSIPRLNPYSANDQELHLMIDRLQELAEYDIHLFNMTMENGIPAIWALAKSRNPGNINLICGAGAHPDPVRAAKSAIHEMAGALVVLQEKFKTDRKELLNMLHDPYYVQQMEDHSMLYALPEAEERLQFLLDQQRPLRTFDEEFKQQVHHADLTDNLKDIIQMFCSLNLDVIVVDQTSQETIRNGLYCVKVLIPGMLPMTFGHHLTRLTGLERVLKLPAELGYAKHPLTIGQLNQHPHPFL